MSKMILLDAPNLGNKEKAYLSKAIDSGYVSTIGPLVGEFERGMAAYLGVKYSVSTQSGTAALHMALYEAGIGHGDEVIVPALTFAATINPVIYVRAKPVFADVDPATFNIDPDDIAKKITKRTKAIIPVHLYGNPCNMSRISDLARKRGILVIEDATESLGAKYRGRHTGTIGHFGCLSFNGNKMITTGGGGMIVGKNKKSIGHIKFLINQARIDRGGYFHPEIGFNYRMTNIEAALGLAQLERLENFVKIKKGFNEIYRRELESCGYVRFQRSEDHAESSYWLNCVILDKAIDVERLRGKLLKKWIQVRRIFIPMTLMPPYKALGKKGFDNARKIYEKGLCLPSSTLNSKEDIIRVCKTLKKIVAG